MRSVFFKQAEPDPELLHLKAEFLAAQGDLAQAYRRFNQAVEPELVDACIFEINAVTARCDYLLRAIKERTAETADSGTPQPRRGTALKRKQRAVAAGKDEKGEIVWT